MVLNEVRDVKNAAPNKLSVLAKNYTKNHISSTRGFFLTCLIDAFFPYI